MHFTGTKSWLSIIVIQGHAKLHKKLFISTCSLHWNIKSSWEVCEKTVLWWNTRIYWMDILCCRCTLELRTLELPYIGNSNVYQQHMLLKLRKPILKYTLNKYQVHWLSSFKHLQLPISIKIPVTIWQIAYIYMTAISMNYALCMVVIWWIEKHIKRRAPL